MAMRILVTRLAQIGSPLSSTNGLPARVCLAHMSSASTPAERPTGSAVKQSTEVRVKKESLRSRLSYLLGGYVEPADQNDPPIPVGEAKFANVTEVATGEEKLYLLAFENGIMDPYCNLPVVRGDRGTKDNPVLYESFTPSRIIACTCEEAQNHFKFTVLNKGEPKRCFCGHWMKLVDAPKFWQKIPKEDLLEIPWFKDLEEEGKLEKFLETGVVDDDHHH